METKGKKTFMNIIMVLLILVVAASGVFTVGKIQGWFDNPEKAVITTETIKGVANIERNGIGYTLNTDTVLQSGDLIGTKKSAQADLLMQDGGKLTLNGNTEFEITTCDQEQIAVNVVQGEVFGDTTSCENALEVSFGENKAVLSEAVFAVSAQAGSSTLQIFAGDVSVVLVDGTQERVETGEYLSIVKEEDGTITYHIEEIQATSLNEFLIEQAQNCDSAELCFAVEELQSVLSAREAEKKAALEASLNSETVISKEDAAPTEEAKNVEQDEAVTENETAEINENETNGQDVNVQQNSGGSVSSAKICTITIVCNTILDNMGNLDAGKEAYVPANGTILAASNVEFEEGETVFDVLNRVCQYAGIQLEYSWTPMYDSYYIEGINNLYEFDCGNESGWMYKVNGWFPNYGCSSYYLEDGDNIVWCYTCNGLGADVGGGNY